MNPLFDDSVRRIIPRWREAATTARLGELGSLRPGMQRFSPAPLQEKFIDWMVDPSLFVAADIVGTALILEDNHEVVVRQAAETILDANSGATPIARCAAERVLHGVPQAQQFSPPMITRGEVYQRIHVLRLALQNDLRNAISWVDLSYLYTLIGETEKAENAMRMALAIAPENRHVLRSATRLYVHHDKKDAALWLLRRCRRTTYDPWLIAAEIGVAGLLDRSSQFAKAGVAMATSGTFAPHTITEVTAALGTLEAEHGNRRKAKKFFELSLQDPNDNVLAQVAWAARTAQAVDIDPENIDVPFSYEARARISFRQRDFRAALVESEAWFNDQRFSVGAAAFASYVAATILAEHDAAVEILRQALVANPDDWTLCNNLAFSLASTDRVDEATAFFRRVSPLPEQAMRHGIWLATSGLLAFRGGDINSGQRLYDEAIALFDQHRLTVPRAVAAIFKAREEQHANLVTAHAAVAAAKEHARSATCPEIEALVAQLDSSHPGQLSLLPDDKRI